MYPMKQNTAESIPVFVHDVTGAPVTGLVDGDFTKRISKASGAFAAMTVTISEMERGFYDCPVSAAHTDTKGILTIVLDPGGTLGAQQAQIQIRVDARLADDQPGGTPAEKVFCWVTEKELVS